MKVFFRNIDDVTYPTISRLYDNYPHINATLAKQPLNVYTIVVEMLGISVETLSPSQITYTKIIYKNIIAISLFICKAYLCKESIFLNVV